MNVGITLPVNVTKIVDGDTIEVETAFKLRVRLLDCWCPELKDEAGQLAKECAEKLLLNKACFMHVPFVKSGEIFKLFTLNRVLGRIYYNDNGEVKNLAEELVKAGHGTLVKNDIGEYFYEC